MENGRSLRECQAVQRGYVCAPFTLCNKPPMEIEGDQRMQVLGSLKASESPEIEPLASTTVQAPDAID